MRDFLKSCGADPDAYSIEGKRKVKEVLASMPKEKDSTRGKTFADVQGVGYLLRSKEICNKENFEVEEYSDPDQPACRKDIGEVMTLQRRSRGFEAFVTGGGIIKKIWPIYNSEGPTQVALLIIRFLVMYLKDTDPALWPNLFLCFDNMCNIDFLKLLRKPLALEGPDSPICHALITILLRFGS